MWGTTYKWQQRLPIIYSRCHRLLARCLLGFLEIINWQLFVNQSAPKTRSQIEICLLFGGGNATSVFFSDEKWRLIAHPTLKKIQLRGQHTKMGRVNGNGLAWPEPGAPPVTPHFEVSSMVSLVKRPETLVTNTGEVLRDHQFLQILHNFRICWRNIFGFQGILQKIKQSHVVKQTGLHLVLVPAVWHHALPAASPHCVAGAIALDEGIPGADETAPITHPGEVKISLLGPFVLWQLGSIGSQQVRHKTDPIQISFQMLYTCQLCQGWKHVPKRPWKIRPAGRNVPRPPNHAGGAHAPLEHAGLMPRQAACGIEETTLVSCLKMSTVVGGKET